MSKEKRKDYETIKVQVSMNVDIVKKIDEYAKSMGISRSALCAMWIGQGVLTYDKTIGSIDSFVSSLASSDSNKRVIK